VNVLTLQKIQKVPFSPSPVKDSAATVLRYGQIFLILIAEANISGQHETIKYLYQDPPEQLSYSLLSTSSQTMKHGSEGRSSKRKSQADDSSLKDRDTKRQQSLKRHVTKKRIVMSEAGTEARISTQPINANPPRHAVRKGEGASSLTTNSKKPVNSSSHDRDDIGFMGLKAESGSESESESGLDKQDEIVQQLPLPPKMALPDLVQASDLRSRLASFLPELQKANTMLQKPGAGLDSRIDDVKDSEEHYIEMELGLGVLREKKSSSAISDRPELGTSDDSESEIDSNSETAPSRDQTAKSQNPRSPMSRLMGEKRSSRHHPTIQEIHNS
jgi:hypothetical protein